MLPLIVNVQEIAIQSYFCIKQGDYFFNYFWDTLYKKIIKVFLFKIKQFKTQQILF